MQIFLWAAFLKNKNYIKTYLSETAWLFRTRKSLELYYIHTDKICPLFSARLRCLDEHRGRARLQQIIVVFVWVVHMRDKTESSDWLVLSKPELHEQTSEGAILISNNDVELQFPELLFLCCVHTCKHICDWSQECVNRIMFDLTRVSSPIYRQKKSLPSSTFLQVEMNGSEKILFCQQLNANTCI